jgi:predicted RNA polymerase sigma factor
MLNRPDLSNEAIRLARALHELLPEDPEVGGLLALMLLTDARRDQRTRAHRALEPLDEQDRTRWDHGLVAEGVALLSGVLGRSPLGPYQLQAAIAAVHDEAPSATETDWQEILALYELLDRVAPNPMATLNRVVAVAEVHGPDAGLALLASLDADDRIAGHHRTIAVRAHLLERTGDVTAARADYLEAARRTTSRPEQRHLEARAARLS